MSSKRLEGIVGFSIDKVADAAGSDPEVLRLENLDTDVPPPVAAIEATRAAVGVDDFNSYLPFTGLTSLREAVAGHMQRTSGNSYHPTQEIVITSSGLSGMLDALFCTTNPGDEVILTDPTYAGMIYRVKLAGAVPKLVPFVIQDGEWRLDLDQLRAAVTERTRAMFIMSPSMPSGAVLNQAEWEAVADLCRRHDLWLIYNAAMERILYDGRPLIHPASLPGMRERTIIGGSVSKEYRMIGWRIGWVVGPQGIMNDVALAHIYNNVVAGGIASAGATAALNGPQDNVTEAVQIWQQRRDRVLEELVWLPVISAAGCWSMLVDVGVLGYSADEASKLLLEKGKVAATPMTAWGQLNSKQFVRLVFSNEPVERLEGLGDRFDRALMS